VAAADDAARGNYMFDDFLQHDDVTPPGLEGVEQPPPLFPVGVQPVDVQGQQVQRPR
jgi:hypothetical protein